MLSCMPQLRLDQRLEHLAKQPALLKKTFDQESVTDLQYPHILDSVDNFKDEFKITWLRNFTLGSHL